MARERTAHIIVDLGYGDGGKGTLIDAYARRTRSKTVIRFHGGAQAGHNVVTPGGRHHTFSQFGSGSFVPGVRTILSRFMVLHPLAMVAEEEHLQTVGVRDAFARVFIEADALVVTPFHQAANRIRELARGASRHGSCGLGIGETQADHLRWGDGIVAGDLCDGTRLRRKLERIRERKREELTSDIVMLQPEAMDELTVFELPYVVDSCVDAFQDFAQQTTIVDPVGMRSLLDADHTLLFEGAQGILLDERYGFHPYTTWSCVRSRNAFTMLDEIRFDGVIETVGVIRAYATRHGAGPFVTEDPALREALRDEHNVFNPWQEHLRVGWFDCVATRYAIEADGRIDALAVTNLDRLASLPAWHAATAYRWGDGRVTNRIPIRHIPDLAAQAKLTEELLRAKPVLEVSTHASAFEDRVQEHVAALEARLGRPVRITSFGPTVGDKRFLDTYFT